jgi:hypothetical protein
MLMHYTSTAISGYFPDIAYHPEKYFFRNLQVFSISIFYPKGGSISPHRLHRSPFAVVYYNFMGYFFVAAAISTRK